MVTEIEMKEQTNVQKMVQERYNNASRQRNIMIRNNFQRAVLDMDMQTLSINEDIIWSFYQEEEEEVDHSLYAQTTKVLCKRKRAVLSSYTHE